MDDALKGFRVRQFFEIEARMLLERYRVIETLLPNSTTRGAAHRGEEGRFIEALLRAFLNKHLPQNLRAISGFVLRPSTKTGVQNLDRVENQKDEHSSQLDIIVFDIASYPVFEHFEEFYIVPPEGVVGIISVKKKLYNSDIEKEVGALRAAAKLCREDERRRGPFTALFAFSSEDQDTGRLNSRIFKAIESESKNGGEFDSLLNEASVLGRTCVFKKRQEHGVDGKARYVGVDCTTEQHIPLQRILQSLLSVTTTIHVLLQKTVPALYHSAREHLRNHLNSA